MSKILAMLVSRLAEGGFGEGPKKAYWWLAGKKTYTAMALGALAAALAWGISSGACDQLGWACADWAAALAKFAGVLLALGLYDGALRSKAPSKLAGLVLLFGLLAGVASAETVQPVPWTAIRLSAWALVLGGLVLAFTFLRTARKFGGPLLVVGLSLALGACASLERLETFPRRPLGVDQGVVETRVCLGDFRGAEVYAQDRGASRAEVTERITRAIEAAFKRRDCCVNNTCREQAAAAAAGRAQ